MDLKGVFDELFSEKFVTEIQDIRRIVLNKGCPFQ